VGCSGDLVYDGGLGGLSTVPPADGVADDDGGGGAAGGDPRVAMLDASGSNGQGAANVRGRAAVLTGVYAAGGARLLVDGCEQDAGPAQGGAGAHLFVGSRLAQYGRFFKGALAEVLVYPRALNDTEVAAVTAYLLAAWPAVKPRARCHAAADDGFRLSQQYAVTRYVHAVQSRNTRFPIKFNGGAFVAAMDKGNREPDTRDWGPSNWWQNTREVSVL
jgi:hypothetical protein